MPRSRETSNPSSGATTRQETRRATTEVRVNDPNEVADAPVNPNQQEVTTNDDDEPMQEQTEDGVAIHQVRQQVFYFEGRAADALLATATYQVEDDDFKVLARQTLDRQQLGNATSF